MQEVYKLLIQLLSDFPQRFENIGRACPLCKDDSCHRLSWHAFVLPGKPICQSLYEDSPDVDDVVLAEIKEAGLTWITETGWDSEEECQWTQRYVTVFESNPHLEMFDSNVRWCILDRNYMYMRSNSMAKGLDDCTRHQIRDRKRTWAAVCPRLAHSEPICTEHMLKCQEGVHRAIRNF